MSPEAVLSFLRTPVSLYILVVCCMLLVISCIPQVLDMFFRLFVFSILLLGAVVLSQSMFVRGCVQRLFMWLSTRVFTLPNPQVNLTSLHDTMSIAVLVESASAKALIDTGSAVTLLSVPFWESLPKKPPVTLVTSSPIVSVDGSPVSVVGKATVAFTVDGRRLTHSVYIADVQAMVILGIDFLRKHNCVIDPSQFTIKLPPPEATSPFSPPPGPCTKPSCHVSLASAVTIPPFTQIVVPWNLGPSNPLTSNQSPRSFLFESRPCISEKFDLDCPNTLVSVSPSARQVPCQMFNYSDHPITLRHGLQLGHLNTCSVVDPPVNKYQPVASVSVPNQSVTASSRFSLSHLSTADLSSVSSLLDEFSCCVSTGPFDTGKTDVLMHSIDTGLSPPICLAPRCLPLHQQQDVKDHIESLLKQDIIRPSRSPWSAPIVVVCKPDGSIQLCVDYRKLNDITTKDAFPMPRIDDAIDAMRGANYFTTLDLASGYWQVRLDDDAQEKAAFATSFGFYQWSCMPFGLCNAPATFQRLMYTVLHDLIPHVCLVYLDDIIIFSSSLQEHLVRLRAVLERLRDAGLKLKPSKCSLAQTSVKYLGHLFSAAGVVPDPAKIAAVSTWPAPTTVTQVRQFLGFVTYCRRFIQDFAKIATPLYAITKKQATFSWSPDAAKAFRKLIDCLTSHPTLAFPNTDRPFILDTDASDFALGAVLSQLDDNGQEHPLAYASKSLSSSQQKYTTTKKELLAVVEFTRHFRHYLHGQKFLLRTDHKSLLWLSSFKAPEGIVARWIEKLSAFDYDIQHRPGPQHANADSLSRLSASACRVSLPTGTATTSTTSDLSTPASSSSSAQVQSSWIPTLSPDALRIAQQQDTDVSPVYKWVQAKDKPSPGSALLANVSPAIHRLWQQFSRLALQEGVLYRHYHAPDDQSQPHLQLVVPTSHRHDVMSAVHNATGSDHLGITRSLDKARQRFYWPKMREDIENRIRTCHECQARKPPTPKPKAPLHSTLSSFPCQRVALDIMGPLPITDRGNRYILVIADYFTKWVEIFPMPNMLATTVSRLLMDGWICCYGAPSTLHSDQGPQFESKLFKDLCRLFNVTKTRTTPYHPQSDGMVERLNRTLQAMLSCTPTDHREWDLHLQHVALAYRSTKHASTGYSPFQLMFGRKPVLPLDLVYNIPYATEPPTSFHHYVADQQRSLTQTFQRARDHGVTAHQLQQKQYDGTAKTPPKFEVGRQVLLHSPVVPSDVSPKFHRYWTGPYVVQKIIDDVTVRLRDPARRDSMKIVHINRLRPYFQLQPPTHPSTTAISPTLDLAFDEPHPAQVPVPPGAQPPAPCSPI